MIQVLIDLLRGSLQLCRGMKAYVLLTAALLATTSIAQNAAPVWSMPSPWPVTPKDANPAAWPMPRIDWLARVETNILHAHEVANKIQLVFDGDSITDAWQLSGKELWAQRYAGLGAFDFGIAGDQTQHLLWRLAQGEVDGIHPKLIAILIGTNNVKNYTAEQIAGATKDIIAGYRKRCPEAAILLQAIFPRNELPTDPMRAKIKTANDAISKLADGDKVIYIDFGDRFLSPDGTISKDVMPDFLHPSAKGYQIWADAIQPIVDKYCSTK